MHLMNSNLFDLALKSYNHLKKRFVFRENDIDRVLDLFGCLHANNEFQGLVDEAVVRTQQFFGVQKCSLMLLNEKKKELFIRGQIGLDVAIAESCKVKLGDGVAGYVALEGRPFCVDNIEKHAIFKRPNRHTYQNKSFLSAPIIYQGKTLGVINVTEKISPGEEKFSRLDLKFLTLIACQISYLMGIRQESITDSLTGMMNFRHFTETLRREFQRSKRYCNPLCLIMIDVDDFKAYNDTFGHLEGDILLKRIANAIKRSIRAADIACRYAGDEFIIILPETETNQAKVVAKKISYTIDQLKSKKKVTTSFGIAKKTLFMKNTKDLIVGVDQALYQAKKEGKDRAFIYG